MRHVIADSVQIIDFIKETEHLKLDNDNGIGKTMLNSIENQSFAAVRSGGPSVLSTVLHRGMASRHLAILWSGFNIQSVVNGTFDMGLIRGTFDKAKFFRNGTSSITGNASMAGAISLENNLVEPNATRINLSATSSKNVNITVTNKARFKRYYHHLALSRTSDKNEYSYYNGGVKKSQKLARFDQWDLNYEGHFIISKKMTLAGGAWLQNAERTIPPTKTSANIVQEQNDKNYRSFLRGSYYFNDRSKIIVRGAYFDELLAYQAPGVYSTAKSKILNGAVDFIHDSGISISSQIRNDKVEASFFVPRHHRNTIAILADYKTTIWKDIKIGLSVRPEWVDKKMQPMVLGFRLDKVLFENFVSTLRYNKGYTLPSFNDLYWPTGGNPDLKTEKSNALEFGFGYKYGVQKTKSLGLNLYLNIIDDWIQWTPIGGFFQPTNQRKIRNLGFEIKVEESLQLNNAGEVRFRVMYSFTDSRLVEHYTNPENEGKMSIFVPQHKLTGSLSFVQNTWQIYLKPLYYSKRFDTVDNSTFTAGYFIVDAEVVKSFKIKENRLLISLGLENSLNKDYENIRFYPIPLRILRFGVDIKL